MAKRWAYIRYDEISGQLMSARWDSNTSSWSGWIVEYNATANKIKLLISDRANGRFSYDELLNGLALDMERKLEAAYLSALYVSRFFGTIEDIHGPEIHQVYKIFGGNQTEKVLECEECGNKGYVSMLNFHFPCSVCHPTRKNERLTSIELRNFLSGAI